MEEPRLAAAAAAFALAACVRTSCSCGEERGREGTVDHVEHAHSLRGGGGGSSSSGRRSIGNLERSGSVAAREISEDDCERSAWRYIAEASVLIKAADETGVAQLALALRRSSSALRLVPQSGTCAHATALWQRSVAFDILGKWSITAIM
jgi:hypothetical protein